MRNRKESFVQTVETRSTPELQHRKVNSHFDLTFFFFKLAKFGPLTSIRLLSQVDSNRQGQVLAPPSQRPGCYLHGKQKAANTGLKVPLSADVMR